MTLPTRQQKRHRCKEQTFGLWENARVGWSERIALKHVYYHMRNRSPVQVWCMRQTAQGQCTGMTLRDGMRREVEGGFRIGNMCTPMAGSYQCMAKTTTMKLAKVPLLEAKTCETDRQSRFDAWDRVLRAGALGWPWGMGWGGRWEGGSEWGTHVHPWLICVNVQQKPLQYCKVICLQLK